MTSDQRLAIHRTRMSWRRTTLSATAVTLVALSHLVLISPRLSPRWTPASPALAAMVGMGFVWLTILVVSQRRIRVLERLSDQGPWAAIGRSPALLGLSVAVYAVLGILMLL